MDPMGYDSTGCVCLWTWGLFEFEEEVFRGWKSDPFPPAVAVFAENWFWWKLVQHLVTQDQWIFFPIWLVKLAHAISQLMRTENRIWHLEDKSQECLLAMFVALNVYINSTWKLALGASSTRSNQNKFHAKPRIAQYVLQRTRRHKIIALEQGFGEIFVYSGAFTRRWFQFFFSPLFGEDLPFD